MRFRGVLGRRTVHLRAEARSIPRNDWGDQCSQKRIITDRNVGVEVERSLGVREINCVLNDGVSDRCELLPPQQLRLGVNYIPRGGHLKVVDKLGEPLGKLPAQGPS